MRASRCACSILPGTVSSGRPVERFAGAVDVAHSTHPLLIPSRAAGVKVVTVHDLDFLDHPERTARGGPPRLPGPGGRHARRADLVVVISEHTARAGARRGLACPPRGSSCAGRARRHGAPGLAARHLGPILFIGTIEPRKNLPTLFAAYERLVARRPDAPPLVLAGRPVEQSAAILDGLRSKTPIAGRVEHRGYVSDPERQALYASASMLVLPSLDEGFGMTAVEAMHAGVPVVVSTGGALPEVVGDAGILVDPTDVAGFVEAMERLLDRSGGTPASRGRRPRTRPPVLLERERGDAAGRLPRRARARGRRAHDAVAAADWRRRARTPRRSDRRRTLPG